MNKFKVGDKVRAVIDINPEEGVSTGYTDEVTGIDRWNSDHIYIAGKTGTWTADYFELANEMKFKAGDRVRLTNDNKGYGRTGATGTILSVNRNDYYVRFDESFHGSTDWYAGSKGNLELFTETKRPAIVARVNIFGQPCPAPMPFVHADKAAATTEAERLARANPDVTFGVYELVARSLAPQPVAVTEAV